jgi:purine nucleosidase
MKRVACSIAVAGLAAVVLLHARAAPAEPAEAAGGGGPRPAFIIDTDMDNDDAAAIAYMCQEHRLGRIQLLGLTITNNGVGLPGKAIQHARCLLAQCGLPDLPVADANLPAPNAFPDSLRAGVDQTLDNALAGCDASDAPSAISAPELIRRLTAHADRDVRLLATGPLSNVAAAIAGRGGAVARDRIAAAYIMGGAVHVGGNLCCGVPDGFDNSQEFNFWTDPAAVRGVFDGLRPGAVTLIPLDATNFVPLTEAFDARLAQHPRTGAAAFVAAMVADPGVADSVPDGFLFWWDPLAAVAATTPGVVGYELDRISVIQSGPSMGALVRDHSGALMRVGISADQGQFEAVFLDTLDAVLGHHHGH